MPHGRGNAGPESSGTLRRRRRPEPRGARPRTPRASAYGGRPAPRVRRSRSRHGCGAPASTCQVLLILFSPGGGASSACFVQQTPIGRHQESHCGGEAPSRLAKPLVSFCSSREFLRVARLPLRRMSTYRSLLRKSEVFGNQMRVQVAIRWGVLRQGRRLLKKLASNDAPNGGLGMLDGAAPAPVGCFAFWLSGKSLMGSGIVRQSGHE